MYAMFLPASVYSFFFAFETMRMLLLSADAACYKIQFQQGGRGTPKFALICPNILRSRFSWVAILVLFLLIVLEVFLHDSSTLFYYVFNIGQLRICIF